MSVRLSDPQGVYQLHEEVRDRLKALGPSWRLTWTEGGYMVQHRTGSGSEATWTTYCTARGLGEVPGAMDRATALEAAAKEAHKRPSGDRAGARAARRREGAS